MVNFFLGLFASPHVKTICKLIRNHPEKFAYTNAGRFETEVEENTVSSEVTVIAIENGLFTIVMAKFFDSGNERVVILSEKGLPIPLTNIDSSLLLSAIKYYLALPQGEPLEFKGQPQ